MLIQRLESPGPITIVVLGFLLGITRDNVMKLYFGTPTTPLDLAVHRCKHHSVHQGRGKPIKWLRLQELRQPVSKMWGFSIGKAFFGVLTVDYKSSYTLDRSLEHESFHDSFVIEE